MRNQNYQSQEVKRIINLTKCILYQHCRGRKWDGWKEAAGSRFPWSCVKGCLEVSQKGFEQGEWQPLGNSDQTLIGPIFAKSTSRGSKVCVGTLKTGFAPWRQWQPPSYKRQPPRKGRASSQSPLRLLNDFTVSIEGNISRRMREGK